MGTNSKCTKLVKVQKSSGTRTTENWEIVRETVLICGQKFSSAQNWIVQKPGTTRVTVNQKIVRKTVSFCR